jgi:hypothetical protein
MIRFPTLSSSFLVLSFVAGMQQVRTSFARRIVFANEVQRNCAAVPEIRTRKGQGILNVERKRQREREIRNKE